MKTLLATAAIVAVLATPAFANDAGRVSLGCTPIPIANAKPDRNPTTRINIDIEFTDAQGKTLETPSFSALHFMADGGHADRWMQYSFDGFQFDQGNKDSGHFVYMGTLRVNPKQIIGMVLWVPHGDQDWYYEEYIGRIGDRLFDHLAVTARCSKEPLHDWDNQSRSDLPPPAPGVTGRLAHYELW
jgi:hypothetical protein